MLIPQHARLQWLRLRRDGQDRGISGAAAMPRTRRAAEHASLGYMGGDASMSDDPVLARVSRHLEPMEDGVLLLLKSHLLIEQQINSALHKIFPGFASLDAGRLTYQQRIQIMRALDGTKKAEDALRFAERLNLVRNRLANQLEPIGIEDTIADFVTEMAASVPIKFDETLPMRLRMIMCIGYICTILHSFEVATSVRSKL